MDASASNPRDLDRGAIRRELWMSCGIWIGVAFFLDVLSAAINHGGFFSCLRALAAARSKVELIDVDKYGLLFPFVCIISILVTAIFAALNVNSKKHRNLTMVVLIGSGFIAGAIYGGKVFEYIMKAEGYTHCESGDHFVGYGRGKVYFTDYALTPEKCPPSEHGR